MIGIGVSNIGNISRKKLEPEKSIVLDIHCSTFFAADIKCINNYL